MADHIITEKINTLQNTADKIRRKVLEIIYKNQSGHLGGSLSVAEIISVLYFSEMNIDPENPDWPDRDRFIPSKGHCAPTLYTALAMKGFLKQEELYDLRQLGCILQGHPCMNSVPGIDISTGSLGHGLSIGLGMALGAQLKKKDFKVYVLLGDGELDEGQNWEAALAAAKYSLSNLIAIVDRNRIQLDGFTEDIMPLEPLEDKWKAFNWHVQSCDGHNLRACLYALDKAILERRRPSVIIGKTIKGKGVSFMEDRANWHGKAPNDDQLSQALTELADPKEV